MLQLIARSPEYVSGYRDYCREFYDNHIVYFRPVHPDFIDDGWFERTKDWYDKKEKGLIKGRPVSFHYWAVDSGINTFWSWEVPRLELPFASSTPTAPLAPITAISALGHA